MPKTERKTSAFFGEEEQREKRRWPWILALLLLVGVPLSLPPWRHKVLLLVGLREQFDAEKWIHAIDGGNFIAVDRKRMVDDLLLSGELRGMTVAEVGDSFGVEAVPRDGEFPLFVGIKSLLGVEHPTREARWIILKIEAGTVLDYHVASK